VIPDGLSEIGLVLLLRDRFEAPIEVDSATSISGLRTMDADTPSTSFI